MDKASPRAPPCTFTSSDGRSKPLHVTCALLAQYAPTLQSDGSYLGNNAGDEADVCLPPEGS
uniref:Uncharacterized protein n=1 Tax=Globisporangium ultimum (strain ATCC 200006 / CBS 805.95 / DAOM BR144) TaxID=431595 RepID=K3WQY3_GLOUD